MALQPGDQAPYTTAIAVTSVMDAWRDRGLGTPITHDVLVRAGVTESLARRTTQSLRQLELIDETSNPTPKFLDMRQARGDDEYKTRLQEWLRGLYADVLQYTDPSTDGPDRVAEAFRTYEPAGQRRSMASLLIGLWRYAGLPVVSESAPRPARTPAVKRIVRGAQAKETDSARGGTVKVNSAPAGLPPALVGLLQQIPAGASWTTRRRDEFLKAFGAVLDFTVPVDDNPPQVSAGNGDEEDSA